MNQPILFQLKLVMPVLAMAAGAVLVRGQVPRVVDGAYLDSLRAEVRTNHPSAAASEARVRAAGAGVRAVRLWEDPMAGFAVMAAEREMRADDGDLMFGAEQVLPRRKLYQARKARATAERSIREAEQQSTMLTLEAQVAKQALELALMDEMIAIATNQLTWLENMTATARERLKDPMSNASEPLRLESELAQEKQKLDSTSRERLRIAQQLNILLGHAADAPWPALRLPETAALSPGFAQEMNQLLEANPMLQALLHTAQAAKLEIDVTRRERSPTLSIGVDSRFYSGSGDLRQTAIGAKVTLPFFNNSIYRANTERAQHEQAAAEREVEALERQLRAEAIAAQTDAENAARQAMTFATEVIPRVEKAAESTQNSWIISRSSILEVLEARRALSNTRTEERRSVAAYRAALETFRSIVPPIAQR